MSSKLLPIPRCLAPLCLGESEVVPIGGVRTVNLISVGDAITWDQIGDDGI